MPHYKEFEASFIEQHPYLKEETRADVDMATDTPKAEELDQFFQGLINKSKS